MEMGGVEESYHLRGKQTIKQTFPMVCGNITVELVMHMRSLSSNSVSSKSLYSNTPFSFGGKRNGKCVRLPVDWLGRCLLLLWLWQMPDSGEFIHGIWKSYVTWLGQLASWRRWCKELCMLLSSQFFKSILFFVVLKLWAENGSLQWKNNCQNYMQWTEHPTVPNIYISRQYLKHVVR